MPDCPAASALGAMTLEQGLGWDAASNNFMRSAAAVSPILFLIFFAALFPGHLTPGQFFLEGDSLVTAAEFKNVIQGSIFSSTQMGWPTGMYAPQFPFGDFLSLTIATLVSSLVKDPIRLYIFMVHIALFLNAISSYWCFRSFGCSRLIALICSTVFAASFFFVVRSTVHFFIAMLAPAALTVRPLSKKQPGSNPVADAIPL